MQCEAKELDAHGTTGGPGDAFTGKSRCIRVRCIRSEEGLKRDAEDALEQAQ